MRVPVSAVLLLLAASPAAPSAAATIVIYADPMTLERRAVVVDPGGPDRAFLCMLPPAEAGCQQVKFRRR